jgi:PAS domain S-box-containing protein
MADLPKPRRHADDHEPAGTPSDMDHIGSTAGGPAVTLINTPEAINAINQRIFETSLDLILVVDSKGNFIRVSPSAATMVGYDPSELIGRNGGDFVYPEDLERIRNEMRIARRTGEARNFECRYRHRDGRMLTLWWTGTWSESEQQHFFIARDITERQALDRSIRERTAELGRANRQLNAIIEAAPLSIYMLSPAGKVVLWTASAERLFGYTAEEAVGGPPPYLDENEIAAWRPAFARTVAAESSGFNETQRRRRDGTIIDVSVTWAPVHDEDGTLLGVMYAIADITERRKLESQLRQAQRMEAIGQLTGGMAHDFNNLLAIIIANLDLLRGDNVPDVGADELIGEAIDAALRGADLTRRLLAFARRQQLLPERIVVNDLVMTVVTLLARTLGESVPITVNLADDLWPITADPAQLESALVNLATNARDAMPRGGQVTIATENRVLDEEYAAAHSEVAAGDYVMIEISDTGSGIPPEVLDRIFEPFFTTKEQGRGTGLGLSMVFGFIKQSRGHVSVYSEVGSGTTFRLYLPRHIGAAASLAQPRAARTVAGGGETILLVEDNDAIRRIVLRQLTQLGYRVLEAPAASAALKVLEGESVDLLFTDVVMPGGMDGVELAHIAIGRWPALKVLLTSGFPEIRVGNGNGDGDGDLMTGLRLLTKPYRREELARALRESLGRDQSGE